MHPLIKFSSFSHDFYQYYLHWNYNFNSFSNSKYLLHSMMLDKQWTVGQILIYSETSMSRYWWDHRLMEISSHGTAILWKPISRDHHSNHEMLFPVWFHESISSHGTSTHGGTTVWKINENIKKNFKISTCPAKPGRVGYHSSILPDFFSKDNQRNYVRDSINNISEDALRIFAGIRPRMSTKKFIWNYWRNTKIRVVKKILNFILN